MNREAHRSGERSPETLLISAPAPPTPSLIRPPAEPTPSWRYWGSLPFRAVATVVAEAGMLVVLVLNWVAWTGAFVVDLALKPRRWRALCHVHFVNRTRQGVNMLRWVAVRVMAPPWYPVGRAPMQLE
jgi:hypothetical protein